ncbi:MAG: aspartate carbamoyltransferase catalytic subunit [Wenzhouxiangella sp.]|nr:MAG: aspartate carbamoyltransferase catalytic subunit [Wenzhouxiangella sp.]
MADPGTRHFLDLDVLSDRDLDWLSARACELARGAAPASVPATVVNLFFEPSTRTRVSFELAARGLGMTVVNVELDRSSSSKGESLEDTAATLAAMGVAAIILRHPETGRCHQLARAVPAGLSLLNAGDGAGHHPSQALLDLATLMDAGIDLKGQTVAIVGDIRHSRVARSDLALFGRSGVAELRVAGPDSMLPDRLPAGVVRADSLDSAVRGAGVIVMLRVQHERMDRQAWPDPASYHRQWGLQPQHLALADPDCRVLHPGPINRGMEISGAVADGPRSLILDQVRMGVHTRMAIFEWLFSDGRLS